MSETVKLDFDSCLEKQTAEIEEIVFETLDGRYLGTVKMRQLTFFEMSTGTFLENLIKSIVEWNLKENEVSEPLPVSIESFEKLTAGKKLKNKYVLGIREHLIRVFAKLNLVTEVERKNSKRQ